MTAVIFVKCLEIFLAELNKIMEYSDLTSSKNFVYESMFAIRGFGTSSVVNLVSVGMLNYGAFCIFILLDFVISKLVSALELRLWQPRACAAFEEREGF